MTKGNRLNLYLDDRMFNYIKGRAERDGLAMAALTKSLLKRMIDQEILDEANKKYKFENGKVTPEKVVVNCSAGGCDGEMEEIDGKIWMCEKCKSVQEIGAYGRLMR